MGKKENNLKGEILEKMSFEVSTVAQWVKDSELLWLRHSLAAAAPI